MSSNIDFIKMLISKCSLIVEFSKSLLVIMLGAVIKENESLSLILLIFFKSKTLIKSKIDFIQGLQIISVGRHVIYSKNLSFSRTLKISFVILIWIFKVLHSKRHIPYFVN